MSKLPGELYDVVIASEVVEHVAQMDSFIQDCARATAPGGLLIVSTLNRTGAAYALGVVVVRAAHCFSRTDACTNASTRFGV